MTEISNLVLRLSTRPVRFSYSDLEAPDSGELSPLVGGDLAYTSWAQGPSGTSNQTDPTTVPLVEAITIAGVDTTATSVEVYWRRPGKQGMTSMGYATDQGGGTWTIAAGFEAVVFEASSDHGSFPWNDIDFLAKIISPEGVRWGAWIDVGISFTDLTPPTDTSIESSYGFDVTYYVDCSTSHSGNLDGYYFSASATVEALDWSLDDGGTFIDYEGNWASDTIQFFEGYVGPIGNQKYVRLTWYGSTNEWWLSGAFAPQNTASVLPGMAWPNGVSERAQVKVIVYRDTATQIRMVVETRTLDGDKQVDVSADAPNNYTQQDTDTDATVGASVWGDLDTAVTIGGDGAGDCFTGNLREMVVTYYDENRSATLFEFRADEVTDYDGTDGGTFTDGQGNTWAINLIGTGASNGICWVGSS